MIEKGKQLRDIDKPIYRYWQALYNSFYNSELYIDVAKRWKGFGFCYLLILVFIFTLAFSVRVISEFNQFFEEEVLQPIKDLPTLYVQNGQVSANEPMPYYVKNKNNQIVAIVDTTGTITAMDKTYPYLSILITKDKLFYRFPSPHFFFTTQKTANNIEVFPFNDKSNSVFEGKDWVKTSGIMRLKLFFATLIYPTIALVAFGIFTVLILAVALMGQFIAKLFFKISISYKQSCRLLTVSMTPFMAALSIILVFGYFASSNGFFMPLLMFSYFCFAVLAFKRESNKLVR